MAWTSLFIAGLLEVLWAYSLKQSVGFTKLAPSVAAIAAMLASFGLLSYAMKSLPLGTAYTVWTGIGAVGAFVVGAAALGEPAGVVRIGAAVLIVAGIILMGLATPH